MDIHLNIINQNLIQLLQRLEVSLDDVYTSEKTDAAVLVAITNEMKPKVLLTRRASHMKTHAGEVSFAGGKTEISDKDNVATALREAKEETQLDPKQVTVVGQLSTQQSSSGMIVTPIVAIIPSFVNLIAQDDEVSRILWVDFDWLITAEVHDYTISTNFLDQSVKLKTPSWQVDGEIVWGLTGRMIANLLKIGFDKNIEWYYRPTE